MFVLQRVGLFFFSHLHEQGSERRDVANGLRVIVLLQSA